MRTGKIIFLTISAIFFFGSCNRVKRLSADDFKWMPYSGKETLIFASNKGEVDTIFLLKKDTGLAYPEAQSLNGIEYQVVSIFCKHSDAAPPDGNHRYLENSFFEIHKSKDGIARLYFDLNAKDATFYRLSDIKIDSLSKVDAHTLETKNKECRDVYIIGGEDWLGNFKQRSNYVTKLYWSKSEGLVRYDKQDGEYWELSKKY